MHARRSITRPAALALLTGALAVSATLTVSPAVSPAVSLAVSLAATSAPAQAGPAPAYPGLIVTPVVEGPWLPTDVEFLPDGRIYVAEKSGLVKLYDGAGDTTPTVVLDLREPVHGQGDRGLLGIAVDPQFASGRPYFYALYVENRDPFGDGTFPRWQEPCEDPPASLDGCTATARLDRFTVDAATGRPDPASLHPVLEGAGGASGGWCFQFGSHAIGSAEFGPDGMLYVGSGDGANFNGVDWGQYGGSPGSPTPANPCNDAPGGRGTALTPADSRGGALRTQAVRAADPGGYVSWNGAILRVDPDTGAAAPGNPLLENEVAGDDRIVAYGLRNPFRFGFRPGTEEVWVGDVGYGTYEEINTFTSGPGQQAVPNFGWPCYEGPDRQLKFDRADLGLCEQLYAAPAQDLDGVASPLTSPYFTWLHDTADQPARGCNPEGGGSVTGGVFVDNETWPAQLQGAYIFADYVHQCIAALPLTDGQPDPSRAVRLVSDVTPVEFTTGPDGEIYFVDIRGRAVHRLAAAGTGNFPPTAAFTATPESGPTPLAVTFDASASADANPADTLRYRWDLDGDRSCDDGTGQTVTRTYTEPGPVTVKLCLNDGSGGRDTATREIHPGASAPQITSASGSSGGTGWAVGDMITLSAQASDADGALSEAAYSWAVDLRHCESQSSDSCHSHPYTELRGPSAELVAPDHEFYAYLVATVTVTDEDGLSATRAVELHPRLSRITLRTDPPGIGVSLADRAGNSPLDLEVIEGGLLQLIVPQTTRLGGRSYVFRGWTDDGAATAQRELSAPAGARGYTALYDAEASYFKEKALARDMAGAQLLVGDFGGNERDDVLALDRDGRNWLFVANPPGGFTKVPLPSRSADFELLSGDFVGDDRDEAVLRYRETGRVELWRFDGTPRATDAVGLSQLVFRAPVGVGSGTVLDGAAGSKAKLFWYGPGEAVDRLDAVDWPAGASGSVRSQSFPVGGDYQVLSGNFDGAERGDLLFFDPGAGSEQVWLMGDDGADSAVRVAGISDIVGDYTPLVGDFTARTGEEIYLFADGAAIDLLANVTSTGGLITLRRPTAATGTPTVLPDARHTILVTRAEEDGVIVRLTPSVSALPLRNTPRSAAAVPIAGDFAGDTARGDLTWVLPAGADWLYHR